MTDYQRGYTAGLRRAAEVVRARAERLSAHVMVKGRHAESVCALCRDLEYAAALDREAAGDGEGEKP